MAYGPYSGPSIQDIIGATMRRYPVPPQPSSMMGRGDTMALSGLGPALSGAYANVQKLLLERKLQQEDLERRRQEAAAIRQEQEENWMRRYQFEARMREQAAQKEREATEQDPWERLRRAQLIGPHVGGVDITSILREMGYPIPTRQVPQGVATVGVPPVGMEGLEAPRPGQQLPQQTIAFGGVREEEAPVFVGRPTRTFTLADVQPDFFGPGKPGAAYGGYPAPLTDGKPDAKKIADLVDKVHGTIPKPAVSEAPHARRGRVTTELGQLADNVQKSIASGLPEDAARAARAFNARLAQANDPRWSLGIPYPPYVMREVVSQATDRKRDIERPPAGGADIVSGLILRDQIAEQRAARAELAKARADLADSTGRVSSLQKSGAVAGRLGPDMNNPTAPSPSARDKALDQALSNQAAAQSRIQVAQERLDVAGATGPKRPAPAGGKPVAGKKTVTAAQLKAYADTYFKGDIAAAKKRAVAEGYTVIP